MTRRRDSADRLAVGLIPILEKRGVTALFAGHDHSYQRHEKAGIQYIVTAGAGAPLYDIDAPIPGITQKAEKTENFVVVRVEGKQARMEALDLDGRRIDAVTMKAATAKRRAGSLRVWPRGAGRAWGGARSGPMARAW